MTRLTALYQPGLPMGEEVVGLAVLYGTGQPMGEECVRTVWALMVSGQSDAGVSLEGLQPDQTCPGKNL